jgi:hypothetical protein
MRRPARTHKRKTTSPEGATNCLSQSRRNVTCAFTSHLKSVRKKKGALSARLDLLSRTGCLSADGPGRPVRSGAVLARLQRTVAAISAAHIHKKEGALFRAPSTGVFFFLTLYFQNNKSPGGNRTFFKIYFCFVRSHLRKFRPPNPLDKIFQESSPSAPSVPF